MTINYQTMGTCTLKLDKSCKVLSSLLTEVFVTSVTSGMCTGSNFKTASALSGLFGRLLTPKVRPQHNSLSQTETHTIPGHRTGPTSKKNLLTSQISDSPHHVPVPPSWGSGRQETPEWTPQERGPWKRRKTQAGTPHDHWPSNHTQRLYCIVYKFFNVA